MSTEAMSRWTSPKKKEFFALHKQAINFYATIALLAQCIWLIFSTRPLTGIIAEQVGISILYAQIASWSVLIFLHFQLKELVKYIFYNLLDDDPNTVSSVMHYCIAGLIIGSMLYLDKQGTTLFFRHADTFVSLEKENAGAHSAQEAQTLKLYESDIATIQRNQVTTKDAITAKYAQKIAQVANKRAYDAQDEINRTRTIAKLRSAAGAEIADANIKSVSQTEQLQSEKNARMRKIDEVHQKKSASISEADNDNAASANSNGWIISLVCCLILIGSTYQSTSLRIQSGQKPVSRLTISDATGSVGSKISDATIDIFQRWMHIGIFHYHNMLTSFARNLDSLDGSFKLDGVEYSNKLTVAPTPPPTSPGGYSDDNNGGGDRTPPVAPAPSPSNAKVEDLLLKRFSEISGEHQLEIASSYNSSYNDGISTRAWLVAFKELNPAVDKFNNLLGDEGLHKNIARIVQNRIQDAPIAPGTETNKTEKNNTTNIVSQQSTVTQKNDVFSKLDDKLEVLRKKILAESESQFLRTDSNNSTVAKRLFSYLDFAYLALNKGGEVSNVVLERFEEAATNRLKLAAKYGFIYDTKTDLIELLNKLKQPTE